LPGLRFHDVRHAYASLLLMQGVHPRIVSERLGHATTAVTLDIYSHVAPGLQAKVVEDLDRLFVRGNS
jgi:integrase